jgi:hypothetical protein
LARLPRPAPAPLRGSPPCSSGVVESAGCVACDCGCLGSRIPDGLLRRFRRSR